MYGKITRILKKIKKIFSTLIFSSKISISLKIFIGPRQQKKFLKSQKIVVFCLDFQATIWYNNSMENIDNYILKVKPDLITGKLPTKKQLEVMLICNPFRAKHVKYSDAAKLLGINKRAIQDRMTSLHKRCPQIWESFRKERFKDRVNHYPKKFDTGCVDCGCEVPKGQDLCYSCWRRRDREANPELYQKDRMFPANGKTWNKIDMDKFDDAISIDDWGYDAGRTTYRY